MSILAYLTGFVLGAALVLLVMGLRERRLKREHTDEMQRWSDAIRAVEAARAARGVDVPAKPSEREQTLAGLLKRCARCLPPDHATRKLATDYLKEQGFFNVLRAAGVNGPRAPTAQEDRWLHGAVKASSTLVAPGKLAPKDDPKEVP